MKILDKFKEHIDEYNESMRIDIKENFNPKVLSKIELNENEMKKISFLGGYIKKKSYITVMLLTIVSVLLIFSNIMIFINLFKGETFAFSSLFLLLILIIIIFFLIKEIMKLKKIDFNSYTRAEYGYLEEKYILHENFWYPKKESYYSNIQLEASKIIIEKIVLLDVFYNEIEVGDRILVISYDDKKAYILK